ncbi:MAG: EI24 domain-containing protein [Ottowia sp.]|nr:EI24 domain-containing protein [Ottowia sp.]
MQPVLDSFLRAVGYCLRPRIIVLSLLPLAIVLGLTTGWIWLYWEPAVLAVAGWLDGSTVFSLAWGWLRHVGVQNPAQALAPFVLVLALAPIIVVSSLLLVAFLTTPAALRLVARRRFPALQRRGANSFARSLGWASLWTVLALIALIVTLPLWFIPPLILVIPPLIWGWLTYRVMSYDALNVHATAAERKQLLERHRGRLLLIGIVCGFLSAAPAVVWASFALFAFAFAILVPLAIWIYTLVFAFSSLWFSHYCLAALQALREDSPAGGAIPANGLAPSRALVKGLPHER